MNVEIGTETAQFPEKEFINGNLLQCTTHCITNILHVFDIWPFINIIETILYIFSQRKRIFPILLNSDKKYLDVHVCSSMMFMENVQSYIFFHLRSEL